MKLFLIMLFFCSTGIFFAQKKDFTGVYQLDRNTLNSGSVPESAMPVTINIVQNSDSISVDMTTGDKRLIKETHKINGTVLSRKTANGSKVNTVFSWSATKDSFLLDRRILNASGEEISKLLENISLLPDHKIKVTRTYKANDKEFIATAIYIRI